MFRKITYLAALAIPLLFTGCQSTVCAMQAVGFCATALGDEPQCYLRAWAGKRVCDHYFKEATFFDRV
ncbi:hypothetical protein A2671_00670 [Candidatus Kaiserbacteria bacterium RIFCSPHIGHO2_01_FULL_49_13]|uniref:Lipoprotein n=1 Tax=Candidatus Kaiserbacteria bacterium RIFCSPHIGHO2_01_FULL_49_13 TaxID=1798477 RepID=A0A1F6CEF2_9BACT|nr:MAG: hypothetical protein A2671_00670 [Candidatus Kaiserbacteria bacterium RIFCSPHIGHO2_01_FULL_49_13]